MSNIETTDVVRISSELMYVITEITKLGLPLFAIVEIKGHTEAKILRTFVSHATAASALRTIEIEAKQLFKGVF